MQQIPAWLKCSSLPNVVYSCSNLTEVAPYTKPEAVVLSCSKRSVLT